jgi:protein TonB
MLAGTLFSVAIFVGLAQLISVPFEIPPRIDTYKIDFTAKRPDTPPVTKRDEKITRDPPTLIPDGPTVMRDDFGDDGVGRLPYERLVLERIDRTSIGVRGVDGDVMPRVRPDPEYPPRALASGIDGWVQVQFTVTAIGTVRDAIVVASEPGTVFDEAALKAIARWRYNPRVDSGVAVERVGLQTVIRFELEN